MTVRELNHEQMVELKIRYYGDRNPDMSYGEIAAIDNLVSDEQMYKEYVGIEFTDDDFFCTETEEV